MGCVWFTVFAALAACSPAAADPKLAAKQCVKMQVHGQSKVSANAAHEALASCEGAVREWLDASMSNACRGGCDYADPRIVAERRDRKRVIEQRLTTSLSEEVTVQPVRM
jgi:hypothetical protein